mmetsp:Transcript_141315/g.439200  ORF Transcript_141315/g.439200 Transcript_141315/m.439200 type:complete len:344 (-) Transcript_141315:98-1129(-)
MAGEPGGADLPYSERPEWRDVEPVPQDDGPSPLAVIRYPPGFEEVHSYFRAIQQRNEFSQRALQLTADVIEHNSANYTAWYYRRRCLQELKSDLQEELIFTDKWSRDAPKNYQVWYHRRWLISEIEAQLRARQGQADAAEAQAMAEEIRGIGERELEYHLDTMQVNDDYKNYNGWSHRQFIVQKFGLWGKEMDFVESLLRDDIRNNSAWNHRYTVVRHTKWPLTDEARKEEIDFTLRSLRSSASNESAWNYLTAFLGEGEGRVPWDAEPSVEAFCREVLAQEPQQPCRFACEGLAHVHEARRETEEALKQYALLKDIDRIRAKYWDWRADFLRERMGLASPAA